MIRIMVVEDEPPILNSICKLLEESGEDLQIVHRAINGKRALDYLEQHPVDIVFSDVKMPVMSGLDLAREVNERFAETAMVIISGYQEFEFARTAIQYGVRNYLLKPISREGLHKVLGEMIADTHKQGTRQMGSLLRRVVAGEPIAGLEVPPPEGGLGLLLYCEGPYPVSPDDYLSFARGLVTVDRVEQFFARQGRVVYMVPGNSIVEKLVMFAAQTPREAAAVAGELYHYIAGQGRNPVTLVVYDGIFEEYDSLTKAFFTLRKNLYRGVRLFHSTFLEKDTPPPAPASFSQWGRDMLLAIKTASIKGILAGTDQLAETLAQKPVQQIRVVAALEKMALNSYASVLTQQKMDDLNLELHACVSRAETPATFANDLADTLYAWAGQNADKGSHELAQFAEKAAAYLKAHYKENFGSQDLADYMGCSVAHLSKKFKEYFGASISEYTNRFRVELSQGMMHQMPDVRIKELAIDVGFSDQYYFSKIFKKVTGQWPTEYLKDL